MFKNKGVYVFPTEKDGIRIFLFSGDVNSDAAELPETTYAKQLIDFLEINLSVIKKIVDNSNKVDLYSNGLNTDKTDMLLKGNYYLVADRFCDDNPVYSFLLTLQMENEIQGKYVRTNLDVERLYYRSVDILENMVKTQVDLFTYAFIYTTTNGSHADKVNKIFTDRPHIMNRSFTEIFSAVKPDIKMFANPQFEIPFRSGYFFNTLEDFMWFIFLNSLRFDVNLSSCEYCGHFFIPLTKRKTRYCDRVRTSDGKTCKDVGPTYLRKLRNKYNPMAKEYNLAVRRNYKRVERTEENTGGKQHKPLTYAEYEAWKEKVQAAKSLWLEQKITDEEFGLAIHEVD